jgi:pimeloyl-ACP methyl ester carboxylesterase
MLWWKDEFCRSLADAGHFVIRYDNRDVGCSTPYETGQPSYTIGERADDAVRVLDAYKIQQAHIVSLSKGGTLTQMIDLRHPERVLAITHLPTLKVK